MKLFIEANNGEMVPVDLIEDLEEYDLSTPAGRKELCEWIESTIESIDDDDEIEENILEDEDNDGDYHD